jgi:hypothetical protein
LVLKEVVEDVAPVQMEFSKSSFWIQVHDMPLICMNREVSYKIGATIGVVEEVDVTGEGVGWGHCLRIRVEVDITKPLERGRVLDLNDKPVWVSFRYKKLPYFCHFCGRIVHDKESCDGKRGFRQNVVDSSRQWGSWLRADDLRSNKGQFWTGGGRSDRQRRGVLFNSGGGDSSDGRKSSEQESEGGEAGWESLEAVIPRVEGTSSVGMCVEGCAVRETDEKKSQEMSSMVEGRNQSISGQGDSMHLIDSSTKEYDVDYSKDLDSLPNIPLVEAENQYSMLGLNKDYEVDQGKEVKSTGDGLKLATEISGAHELVFQQEGVTTVAFDDNAGKSKDEGAHPRTWVRRARIQSKSQGLAKGGKRNIEDILLGGDDVEMQVKKGRLVQEEYTNWDLAVAGLQPRQSK